MWLVECARGREPGDLVVAEAQVLPRTKLLCWPKVGPPVVTLDGVRLR